jgi:hypothetical protein
MEGLLERILPFERNPEHRTIGEGIDGFPGRRSRETDRRYAEFDPLFYPSGQG